jgi:hypothetical protein
LLHQPIIVENRPGANAIVANADVARAKADGYTLLFASATPMVITPHTFANTPYDTLRDFIGITTVGITPEAIVINMSLPARNLKELIALSKTRQITLASSGNGGLPHMAIEIFKKLAHGNVVHVPYNGAAKAANDVMGGHVSGIIIDLPVISNLIKEGKMRGIAITALRFPRIAYHDYEGISGDEDECERLVSDLGDAEAMILRNHGLLAAGPTIAQAFNNIYRLERASQVQLQAMATNTELVVLSPEVAARTTAQYARNPAAARDGKSSPMGMLEWPALLRILDRQNPSYKE